MVAAYLGLKDTYLEWITHFGYGWKMSCFDACVLHGEYGCNDRDGINTIS